MGTMKQLVPSFFKGVILTILICPPVGGFIGFMTVFLSPLDSSLGLLFTYIFFSYLGGLIPAFISAAVIWFMIFFLTKYKVRRYGVISILLSSFLASAGFIGVTNYFPWLLMCFFASCAAFFVVNKFCSKDIIGFHNKRL